MMNSVTRYSYLAGRILLSLIFIVSGLAKVAHWSGTAAMMASKAIPLVSVSLLLTILVELGGGLALLIGFRARLTALALALYLVPVTLLFHNFWVYQGMNQQMQMVNFLKNLAIVGGLLNLASEGAGAISLDARHQQSCAAPR